MKVRPIKHAFLIFIIIAVTFSCREKRVDNSLPVNEYVALGVPDPNKKWNLEDFKQAYNVLAQRNWAHPLELPLKDSEKSGLLFEHMVSLDYLAFLEDTTISLNEKAGRISEFTKVYDYWIDIYTIPILSENPYGREILDIQIFNLRVMEAMLDLAHKINKSDDPADAALRYGYKSIKENYLTCLNNDIKTQRKASEFFKQDLDRMADTIYMSVMRNREWMDSSAVAELNRSLQQVIDSASSDYVRSKYRALEKSLTGA